MRRDKSFRSASRSATSRKKRGTYARQLGFESLEDRRVLATVVTFNAVSGLLTIDMQNAADDATLVFNGVTGEFEVPEQAGGGPITNDPTPANLKRIVAMGAAGATNEFTINAGPSLALPEGMSVNAQVESFVLKTGIFSGAAITIGSNTTVSSLENDIGTTDADVTIFGTVNLVGGPRVIQTNVGGASGGNVSLQNVTATALASLSIDARGSTASNGGTITFANIGAGAGNALGSFTAVTNAGIDFSGGDVIQTDAGNILLQASTLDVAALDDVFDTEVDGNDPAGAVDLGNVALIRNIGATIPHILTIDTTGTTKGAVTLPTSGQFVEGTPTTNFDNFNDSLNNRVLIRVATVTNFTEDFTNPNAFNRFASQFFSQVGTNFVAAPPVGRKAVAVVNPVEIVPPLSTSFKANVTATISNTPGRFRNGFIIFDAVNSENFKFAGAFHGRRQFSVGEVVNGRVIHRNTAPIASGLTFNLSVNVNATTGRATLSNNGTSVAGFTFGSGINQANGIGMGTNNSNTSFSNFFLRS